MGEISMLQGIYSDESGNNGFGDTNQPVLYYGGILVPMDKQANLDTNIEAIKNGVFTKIASKIQGIPKKDLLQISFFRDFEIHSRDFYEGDSFYSKLTFAERFSVLEDILKLVKSNNLMVCASVINKISYKNDTGDQKHRKMHEKGYAEFLNVANNTLDANGHYGFVVSDECRDDEAELFTSKLRNQPTGHRIYPHLVIEKSHCCNLVQLADIIAFVITGYYWNQLGLRQRKNNNQQVIDLYNNYLHGNVNIWEYK